MSVEKIYVVIKEECVVLQDGRDIVFKRFFSFNKTKEGAKEAMAEWRKKEGGHKNTWKILEEELGA